MDCLTIQVKISAVNSHNNQGVSISINMAICIASVVLSNRFSQSKWAQHPMASMMTNMMMDR